MLTNVDWCSMMYWVIWGLMLTDANWCGLMLTDADWCWLMLIDANWYWLSNANWCRWVYCLMSWLTLTDFDWCWLIHRGIRWLMLGDVKGGWVILSDAYWCWLMRIDKDCPNQGQCVKKLSRIDVSTNQVKVFIKWNKSVLKYISPDSIN